MRNHRLAPSGHRVAANAVVVRARCRNSRRPAMVYHRGGSTPCSAGSLRRQHLGKANSTYLERRSRKTPFKSGIYRTVFDILRRRI